MVYLRNLPALLLAFISVQIVLGAPLFGIFEDDDDDDITAAVSAQTISDNFARPAQFSRVAYCSSNAVTSWQCGPPCDSIGKGVTVIQAGGDDGLVPMYFVAHDPASNTIVVAHQGTEPSNFLSVLNDAQFLLVDLNTTRFTAAEGKGIEVHDGFQKTFERTADGVLEGVQKGLDSFGSSKVLVTGHSLGASIASLDAMMLKEKLDPSVEITTTVFGLPRVGNQEWADFVDVTLGSSFTHITNQDDPVPIVPPRFLGYQHPSNEVHIKAVDNAGQATDVVACPGPQDKRTALAQRVTLSCLLVFLTILVSDCF
ncbi:hypothetical protein Moror_12502 [Moniliophthora roreri MCA 2997]|uniref:Fungal lipase-type domain-containing protein n=1 Tax=Moniliophthora roreri (strain MCA 2997) TaxID=1381753 RepID=V2X971_MONRO|nr:hypothetical protein Moror_12502 [Moniliophthora roreri MCA 2997]